MPDHKARKPDPGERSLPMKELPTRILFQRSVRLRHRSLSDYPRLTYNMTIVKTFRPDS
jgi:hypothetical protein